MNALANTKVISREEWLALRRKGIGGSDIGAIVGVNPWKSPMAVYLEKIGDIQPEEPGEAAYWGITLEEIIAKEFSKRTGLKVQRRNSMLIHPEYDFIIANLDRQIIDKKNGNGVLECKATSEYKRDEWDEDKIPDMYLLQVQHYLAVTGLSYGYIAVLIGGNKFRYKQISRDEEIINYLIKIETDFWKMVENRTPPEMDGSDSSSEVLGLLYPKAQEGTAIEFPSDTVRLIDLYQDAAYEERHWAGLRDTYANQIKNLLGDNEAGTVEQFKVTWKNVTSNRIDTKELQEKRPEIYSQFLKQSTYRKFNIGRNK